MTFSYKHQKTGKQEVSRTHHHIMLRYLIQIHVMIDIKWQDILSIDVITK